MIVKNSTPQFTVRPLTCLPVNCWLNIFMLGVLAIMCLYGGYVMRIAFRLVYYFNSLGCAYISLPLVVHSLYFISVPLIDPHLVFFFHSYRLFSFQAPHLLFHQLSPLLLQEILYFCHQTSKGAFVKGRYDICFACALGANGDSLFPEMREVSLGFESRKRKRKNFPK